MRKRKARIHEFVLSADAFSAAKKGWRSTEVLRGPGDMSPGDVVVFRNGETGKSLRRRIAHAVMGPTPAIREGYAVVEFSRPAPPLVYAFGVLVGLFLGAFLDSEMRAQEDKDLFTLFRPLMVRLNSQPRVTEEERVFANTSPPGDVWTVCVYDGAAPSNLLLGTAGGDDFREIAAMPKTFTHRINARSSASAARSLKQLVAAACQANAKIKFVAIMDHANRAGQLLGTRLVEDELFAACGEALRHPDSAGLYLLGCKTASGPVGREYLRLIARSYGYAVTGSAQIVSVKGRAGEKSLYFADAWRVTPEGVVTGPVK